MPSEKLPKGVKVIKRLSVMRRCGHVLHLTERPSRYAYKYLVELTATPCDDCAEEPHDAKEQK